MFLVSYLTNLIFSIKKNENREDISPLNELKHKNVNNKNGSN